MSSPTAADALPAPSPCAASDGQALAESPARQEARAALKAVDEARAHGHPIVLCEALTDAARCLAALNAYTQSEDYLVQALHWAGVLQSADLRSDLFCALAEVACNEADLTVQRRDNTPEGLATREAARERARDWSHEAVALAHRTSDPQWEMKVLLRAADVLERGGDHEAAVQVQGRALALMGLAQPEIDPDEIEFAHSGQLQAIAKGMQLM